VTLCPGPAAHTIATMDPVTPDSTFDATESRVVGGVELPRRIRLPDGRSISVRMVEPSDAHHLERLFERMDDEDRYRRFFSPHHPAPAFFEWLAAIDDRDGVAVVVVDLADDELPIVAEADYELLENGNGEMAIVVDRQWRGWVGPYLVGVLAAIAADRGVANLEAEVLTVNRPMRTLTRNRGEAILPGSDWQTVRVEFPTSGRAPGWFATDRPKVLLETRSSPFEMLDDLASDYTVVACAGPSGRPRPCPLLDGGECPLAGGADAIVIAMPADEVRDSLEAAHQARHGQVPVEVLDPGRITSRCRAVRSAVERALVRSVATTAAEHDESCE
jgi:GNAT superfamily N-acetyltransferase